VPRSSTELAAIRKYYGAATSSSRAASERGVTLRLLPGGRLIPGGSGDRREVVFVYHNNMARENLWDNWDTLLAQLFTSYPTQDGFRPLDTVHATPPYALEVLTRIMEQRGIAPSSTDIRLLVGTGSHFGTDRRRRLCEAWNADFYTTYSCAELNHTARECPLHPKHYHFDAVSHVEVVDERTSAHVGINEQGRVLLTGLFPFHQAAMLIRYAVGDWARWLGNGPCACGATAPTIELLGREKDCVPLRADGRSALRLCSAPTLEGLERFAYVPKIPRPQFRWDTRRVGEGHLRLDVECYALGSAAWQRARGEELRDAILKEMPALTDELRAADIDFEVALHPRSALTISLPAR
jgi:hypothetical protein